MLNIEDKAYAPSVEELIEYTQTPLFASLYTQMQELYSPKVNIEYSGDKVLLGWNMKYRKAGKTLCTVYPRKGFFYMLLIVGRKEKPTVENMLSDFDTQTREIYHNTKEGMGQRWMILKFSEPTPLYEDALKIIKVRREAK